MGKRTRRGQGLAASVARWARRVSLRWGAVDKYPWIAAAIAIAVVATFVLVLSALQAQRVVRQNLTCLALNVYYEARGEPEAGRYAVAEVTMNRVASKRYPDTVCDVVYEKNWDVLRKRYVSAFSWTEFKSQPEPAGTDWDSARRIADDVYYGRSERKLVGVTHYHADYIHPSWSRHRTPVARIGNHVFYR